ncbi:hypothetical protein ACFL6Z_01885 [Pseudomonadota bacterium]
MNLRLFEQVASVEQVAHRTILVQHSSATLLCRTLDGHEQSAESFGYRCIRYR